MHIHICIIFSLPKTYAISHAPLLPQYPSSKRTNHPACYAHKSCTITYQGFQLWSPLKSFTNACHSCQSGMWLQYTHLQLRCVWWPGTSFSEGSTLYRIPIFDPKAQTIDIMLCCKFGPLTRTIRSIPYYRISSMIYRTSSIVVFFLAALHLHQVPARSGEQEALGL